MFRFGTSLFVSILCFAGMSTMAQSAGQPTDPQIAHIAYTAGQIDIKAAEQALGKSQNKNVKAFAEEMVRDHEAVNKKALALLDKLSVKPEEPLAKFIDRVIFPPLEGASLLPSVKPELV